jgi:methionine synthase II (cobalamin-independent)
LARKAKKTVKKQVRRRRTQENSNVQYVPGPVMEMLMHAAASQPKNLARSSDARSEVLGALAGVLSDVTTAVQALGTIANSAPAISNTESRQ